MRLQAPLSPPPSSSLRLPQLARRITLLTRASAAAQIAVRPLQDTQMARLFAMDTSPSRRMVLPACSGPGSGSYSASQLFRFIRTKYVESVTPFVITLLSLLWTGYADCVVVIFCRTRLSQAWFILQMSLSLTALSSSRTAFLLRPRTVGCGCRSRATRRFMVGRMISMPGHL